MAINGQKLSDAILAVAPVDGSSADRTRVDNFVLRDSKEVWVPLAAGGDITALGIFSPLNTILIDSVKVEPMNSVASNGTSYWQFQLVYDDDAGGSDTAITTTFSGSVTALTATVPVSLTLSTTGGVTVPANSRVALIVTGNDTVAANTFGVRVSFKKLG